MLARHRKYAEAAYNLGRGKSFRPVPLLVYRGCGYSRTVDEWDFHDILSPDMIGNIDWAIIATWPL